MVHDRVLSQVRAKFPAQTPLLVGDPGRVVFSDLRTQPTFAALVTSVKADGRLELGCGLASGLTDGAEFAIYPRTAADLTRTEDRTALARLTNAKDVTSEAEVVERFGQQAIEAGDQAVLLAAAATLRRRVRFVEVVDRQVRPAPADDPRLLAVRKALPGNGWVEAAAPDEPADFAVHVAGGQRYEILNADGTPIPLRPDLPVGDGSPRKVVGRLVHLAKFQAVLGLANQSPDAKLQKRLKVELLALPDGFDPSRRPWPEARVITDPAPVVTAGQWLALRITSRWPSEVNVAVLDLDVNWSVTQVHPQREPFDGVDSDGEPLTIPFTAGLPDGFTEGTDTLKVVASLAPLSLLPLTLPALDAPLPAGRGTRGPAENALNRLLRAIDSPAPLRSFAAAPVKGQEWAAFQFTVRVQQKAATQ
jgi:hypothetical protein